MKGKVLDIVQKILIIIYFIDFFLTIINPKWGWVCIFLILGSILLSALKIFQRKQEGKKAAQIDVTAMITGIVFILLIIITFIENLPGKLE